MKKVPHFQFKIDDFYNIVFELLNCVHLLQLNIF